MNPEKHLISKILNETDGITSLYEIARASFSDKFFLDYSDEYEYIRSSALKYGKVPDAVTFQSKFPDFDLDDTPEPLRYYIDETKKSFVYSKVVAVNNELVNFLRKGEATEALDFMSSEVLKISQVVTVDNEVDLHASLDDRIRNYDDRRTQSAVTGVPTGISAIDLETTGFQNGELIFLAGRPGSFKTWNLLDWAVTAWESGRDTLIFSREMNAEQLYRRLDSLLAQVPFNHIRKGTLSDDDFLIFQQNLESRIKSMTNFIKIIDSRGKEGYKTSFIQSKIKERKPSVVFIDGAYLIKGNGGSEWEKQTSITRELKQIALEENIPIIGTTQLNKSEDLAFSDTYLQDADNVFFLKPIINDVTGKPTGEVFLDAKKSREAELLRVKLMVDLEMMLITEVQTQAFSGGFQTP